MALARRRDPCLRIPPASSTLDGMSFHCEKQLFSGEIPLQQTLKE